VKLIARLFGIMGTITQYNTYLSAQKTFLDNVESGLGGPKDVKIKWVAFSLPTYLHFVLSIMKSVRLCTTWHETMGDVLPNAFVQLIMIGFLNCWILCII